MRGKNAGQEGKREARVRQGTSRTKIDRSLVRQTEMDRDCERQKQKETDRQRLREAEAGRLIDRDKERETDGCRLARENKRELYGRKGSCQYETERQVVRKSKRRIERARKRWSREKEMR